jgi:hypothetical protein
MGSLGTFKPVKNPRIAFLEFKIPASHDKKDLFNISLLGKSNLVSWSS